ncbi:hypothetical protein HZU77_004245 [Neisseriaceae bacterium TC5R-5]|nr:hypothetical protein [Neisseriaceae bacterium TC5R-5]
MKQAALSGLGARLLLACCPLILLPVPAQAIEWMDNAVYYRYGARFTEPGNPKRIAKNIVGFTHLSGYQYGSHFFNLEALYSNAADPAYQSSAGAREIYAVYRHQLPWGKLSGQPISNSWLRDLALTFGVDANTKNSRVKPQKRLVVIGPTLKLDVPGVWDISLFYYRESNHNALPGTQQAHVNFDPSWQLASNWSVPFTLGNIPVKYSGIASYTAAKGKNYFAKDTAGETVFRSALLIDVGAMAGWSKQVFYAGIGYEYWRNKFGNQPALGTQTSTSSINMEWHF